MQERAIDRPWHAMTVEEVLAGVDTRPEGLDPADAGRRLEVYGPNTLAEVRQLSPVFRFLLQFKSPLIYILLVASVISFALGEMIDGSVILFIVFFNAVIGFVQEYKAEQALAALKRMAAPTATVLRSGEEEEIPSEQVVPGDVMLVQAGDRAPADGRVIEAAHLKVEEAALTGESVPVDKTEDPVPEDTPLAERANMIYSGTTVASGRGIAVVTATGNQTQTGQIAADVQSVVAVETPIQRKLGQIGRLLAVAGIAVAAVLIAMGLLRGFGMYTLFLTAVAAAVSFIPEGLPAIVTIVLAVGVQRMARRNAIIRKLPAVEALGSATVIATDKTGTLTQNQMTVRVCCTPEGTFRVTGEGYRPEGRFLLDSSPVETADRPDLQLLFTVASLSNDARLIEHDDEWSIAGDPTEGALLVAARKAGLKKRVLEEQYPRVDEIPFDSELRYMATLNRRQSGPSLMCVKGAPEKVIGMCARIRDDGGDTELSQDRKNRLLETNASMASDAYRMLAMAYKDLTADRDAISHHDAESGLTFLGMVGMLDPPRPEVHEAVRAAKGAGIRLLMVTGDNPITARAIADMLDMRDGKQVVSGRDLERMTDEELARRIEEMSVFARVEPQHKYRIVQALKSNGELVAMTGDGVNDAPALKRADIGISMGITGTDVAREASDMVLADDNFATIVAAVEEGRTIFANLRKVVQYLLSTNTGEVLTFFVAVAAGFPLPLLPVQILWVNLVTDGFATAPLSVEPKEGDVLHQPPRPPDEPVITRRMMARIGMVAVIMAIGTLGLFLYGLADGGLAVGRTVAFATLAIFQLFNTFNIRSSTQSIFKLGLLSNLWVIAGVSLSLVLQILAVELPLLQGVFRTVGLSWGQWGLVMLVSSSVLIVEEIRKAVAPDLFSPASR